PGARSRATIARLASGRIARARHRRYVGLERRGPGRARARTHRESDAHADDGTERDHSRAERLGTRVAGRRRSPGLGLRRYASHAFGSSGPSEGEPSTRLREALTPSPTRPPTDGAPRVPSRGAPLS